MRLCSERTFGCGKYTAFFVERILLIVNIEINGGRRGPNTGFFGRLKDCAADHDVWTSGAGDGHVRERMGVEMDIVQRCNIVIIEDEIVAPLVVDVESTSWL